jgi:hypothetical protein
LEGTYAVPMAEPARLSTCRREETRDMFVPHCAGPSAGPRLGSRTSVLCRCRVMRTVQPSSDYGWDGLGDRRAK